MTIIQTMKINKIKLMKFTWKRVNFEIYSMDSMSPVTGAWSASTISNILIEREGISVREFRFETQRMCAEGYEIERLNTQQTQKL